MSKRQIIVTLENDQPASVRFVGIVDDNDKVSVARDAIAAIVANVPNVEPVQRRQARK